MRSTVYLPFGLAFLAAWLLYRWTRSRSLGASSAAILVVTVAAWQELPVGRAIERTLEVLLRDADRSLEWALSGALDTPTAELEATHSPEPLDIVAPLEVTPLGRLLLGAPDGVDEGEGAAPTSRLRYGTEPPNACEPERVGAVYYDTEQKAVFLCDGKEWAGIAQVPTCATPNVDLTNSTYVHYGSGNCGPYYHDQSWMSRDDKYVAGNYGWHDGCGKVDREPYCAIEYPSSVKVTRFRVLLHEAPPSHCLFQGSQDSSDGTNGTWTSLFGPVDFPTNHEGQWSQDMRFENPVGYKLYRLYCPGSPSFALYEWEMFCGG